MALPLVLRTPLRLASVRRVSSAARVASWQVCPWSLRGALCCWPLPGWAACRTPWSLWPWRPQTPCSSSPGVEEHALLCVRGTGSTLCGMHKLAAHSSVVKQPAASQVCCALGAFETVGSE